KVPVRRIVFLTKGAKDELLLDGRRGHLPVQLTIGRTGSYGGKQNLYMETHYKLLEAKEFSRGRWFPTYVLRWPAEAKLGVGQVQWPMWVYRVTELIVDEPLENKDFELPVPAQTVVQWYRVKGREGQRFFTKQNEKILPSDLPRLTEMLVKSGQVRRMDTAIHQPSGNNLWKWALIGGGASMLVGGFIYRRRRVAKAS